SPKGRAVWLPLRNHGLPESGAQVRARIRLAVPASWFAYRRVSLPVQQAVAATTRFSRSQEVSKWSPQAEVSQGVYLIREAPQGSTRSPSARPNCRSSLRQPHVHQYLSFRNRREPWEIPRGMSPTSVRP